MKKKVLLFTAYFPPRRRVGSLRPFRFATQLKNRGWDVYVISIKDSKASLTSEEQAMLEGIHQFEIEAPFDQTQQKTGKKDSGHKAKPLSDFIDRNFPIDTWLPLFWRNHKQIIEYVGSIKPDIMWSSSDPWSVNHTARKIAHRFKLPWVADFRDPWTLCSVRYGSRSWPLGHIDRKAERRILEEADHITFTAASTQKKYEQHYTFITEKSSVIYNAFRQYSKEDLRLDAEPELDQEKLNILFLGTFRALSSAESILRVLNVFKQKYADHLNQLRIYSMAELRGTDRNRAGRLGLDRLFLSIKRVPNTQVQALQHYFDLNLLSTHPERNDIIPAKLFDYLPSENPIFSLAPNPEVGEIIRKTQRGFHFEPGETEQAADQLFHLLKLKKGANLKADRLKVNTEALIPYTEEATASRLEDIFNQILKDG